MHKILRRSSDRGDVRGRRQAQELPLVPSSQQPTSHLMEVEASGRTKSNSTKNDYGMKILHDPEDALIDIIFIHGLNGNRESAWTKRGKPAACFWPKDLLADDIPNARIATWGYDSDVISKRPLEVVSTNGIRQHAETLCSDLAHFRNEAERPIFFVAHSLGGLVCKAALLHASEAKTEEQSHIGAILEYTRAIAFLGTPHQGSDQAKIGSILASIVTMVKQGNAAIVQELEKESPQLDDIQNRFYSLLAARKQQNNAIEITCFYEELPMPLIGMVVSQQSARMLGYIPIGVHADHEGIAKFGSDDNPGYIRIRGELQRWLGNLQRSKDEVTEDGKSNATSATKMGVHHYGNVDSGANAFYGSQTFSGSGFTFGGVHHGKN